MNLRTGRVGLPIATLTHKVPRQLKTGTGNSADTPTRDLNRLGYNCSFYQMEVSRTNSRRDKIHVGIRKEITAKAWASGWGRGLKSLARDRMKGQLE